MKKQSFVDKLKKEYLGTLFILPVILGLVLFTLTPMVTSLWNSFNKISILNEKTFVGLQNYRDIFKDQIALQSLRSTLLYTVVYIPVNLILSFSLALLLNREIKGIGFFRVLCYAPVVIPTVVNGLLWMTVTDSKRGYLNLLFETLGMKPLKFFTTPETAFFSFIFVSMFGIGSGMIIWLSQLKNIPRSMYESADLEGANAWKKLTRITIPLCSPTIFFNLVLNVIGTLQVFDMAFMFKNPLNEKALNFFGVYIYQKAFTEFGKMGYASALSWVMFAIIAVLSAIVFCTNKWVYYGEDTD